eukprot:570178-Pyramimonas_sp.AAC.1
MAKGGKRGRPQKREYFACSNPKCGGWGYCDISQFCGECGKKFQGRGKGRGDDRASSPAVPAGANRWKGGKHAARDSKENDRQGEHAPAKLDDPAAAATNSDQDQVAHYQDLVQFWKEREGAGGSNYARA